MRESRCSYRSQEWIPGLSHPKLTLVALNSTAHVTVPEIEGGQVLWGPVHQLHPDVAAAPS